MFEYLAFVQSLLRGQTLRGLTRQKKERKDLSGFPYLFERLVT